MTGKVIKITENSKLPQEVVGKINSLKPSGISLFSYKMDLGSGNIRAGGRSANRQSLVELKKNLEESEDFSQVQIPLSSLEQETNIEFEVSFLYGEPKKGVIKIPIK